MEIGFDDAAQALLMEGSSRMVHSEIDHPSLFLPRAMDLADALSGEEPAQRMATQGHDNPGRNEFDLAVEPLLAGVDLLGQWVSILRGSAFQHVADVDLAPLQSDGGQQLIEEVAGGSDKGTTLLILIESRRLTDEHYLGILRPLASHNPVAIPSQLAILTQLNLVIEFR